MLEEIANYNRIVFAVKNNGESVKSVDTGISYVFCLVCFEHKDGRFSLVLKIEPVGVSTDVSHVHQFSNMKKVTEIAAKIISKFKFEDISIIHFDDAYGIDEEEKFLNMW